MQYSDTVTASGAGSSQTYNVTLALPQSPPASQSGITPSASFTLQGNTFNAVPGADFTPYNATTAPNGANGTGGPWNFQDDYYFSTTGATLQSAAISLSSNLQDVQARFVYANSATMASSSNPVLGPAGGNIVPGDGWQTFNFSGGSAAVTMPVAVGQGSYILQVRGEVSPAPGSYGGTIQFNPVPLPAALPLLLSGLGLLGFGARGRRA